MYSFLYFVKNKFYLVKIYVKSIYKYGNIREMEIEIR